MDVNLIVEAVRAGGVLSTLLWILLIAVVIVIVVWAVKMIVK
jgi:hypothetical protein